MLFLVEIDKHVEDELEFVLECLVPGEEPGEFFDPNQETDDSEMTRCYVTMSH